jgi:hypothetical protein
MREDGREEVVVAGGYSGAAPLDTVEIYSVEESRWRASTAYAHQFYMN